MRKILSAALISCFLVSGCSSISESRANPFNWFGGSDTEATTVEPEGEPNPLIPDSAGFFEASRAERARYKGVPVQSVSEVTLEKVPGGVMILATGITSMQGAYDAQLTPVNSREEPEDGVLSYRLEAIPDPDARNPGSLQARTVEVGRTIRDQELADTRIIRIIAATNVRDTNRR